MLSRRFEPYIRQQAEDYLRNRFRADVRIGSLHVRMPQLSPLRVLFTRGSGALASVDGEGIYLRLKDRAGGPPLVGGGRSIGPHQVVQLVTEEPAGFVGRRIEVEMVAGPELAHGHLAEHRTHPSVQVPSAE